MPRISRRDTVSFRAPARLWPLVVLVTCAVSLRLGVALASGALTAAPNGDERLFDPIARHLAAGEGYSIDGVQPTAIRPPVYPAALATIYAATEGSMAVARICNVLLGGLTVALIVLVGTRYFGPTAGLLAGTLSAVYPPWVQLSSRLLSDPLYLALVVLLIYSLQRADDAGPGLWPWIVSGMLLGLCVLTRSEAVLLVALLPLALLVSQGWRRSAPHALAVALPAVLLVAPWVVRNQLAIGSPVLASNLGQVILGVYQPKNFTADELLGTWGPPDPPVWNAAQYAPGSRGGEGEYLPEREYNRVLTSRGVASIREHVGQLPRMLLAKLNRFFLSRGHIENLTRFAMVYCFIFGELLLLTAGWRSTWALQTTFVANLIVGVVLYADDRLRMTADLALLLIGSFGFLQQWRMLRERAARGLAVP